MNPGQALEFVRLLRLRERLRARDLWSRERLLAFQARALARLRHDAVQHSPFYSVFHAGLQGRPIDELPILTKQQAMEEFDRIVNDPHVRRADVERHVVEAKEEPYLGRYWVSATSGSTGRRGIFIFDPDEWRMVLTSFGRGSDWAGLGASLRRRVRVATVTTRSTFHMSARAGATLPRFWLPTLRLDAAAPIRQLAARLDGWRPEVLVTYPSIAVMLAEEAIAGRLGIAPRIVETGAEMLSPAARTLIERAWGCRVFDQYGATETGGIAAECEAHRGLHVFEDLVLVESVDSDSRAVPAGVLGERLLVTVLFGRSFPLIRYELSDQVRLSAEPCPCGRPFRLIEAIEGRAEETLSLPGRDGGTAKLHPIVLHQLLDKVAARAWQVIHDEASGTLEVQLVGPSDEGVAGGLAASLERTLAEHGSAVPVSVRVVGSVDRGPTGKVPLIRTERAERREAATDAP